jgi:hypothetical protein
MRDWVEQVTRRGTPAACGCCWETGSWEVCERHRTPHAQHSPEDRAPWCDACYSGNAVVGADISPTGGA